MRTVYLSKLYGTYLVHSLILLLHILDCFEDLIVLRLPDINLLQEIVLAAFFFFIHPNNDLLHLIMQVL